MKITNKTKVEECAISVRLRKCLKSCDIETIGDLLNKNTFYFAQQSVFGRMSLNELATFMKYNNLKFKGDFETDNIDWEQRTEEYFVNKMWPEGTKPCCERPHLRTENGKVYVENDLSIYSAIYRIKNKEGNWHLYTSPVSLKAGECIVLKLERIGYKDSEPVEFQFM